MVNSPEHPPIHPHPLFSSQTAHRSTPTRQHTEKLKLYVEPSETGELHVFAGNSNRELAAEVAAKLDMQVGRVTARRFADGECNIQVMAVFQLNAN